ncbi:MAG TPA: hypothetical protein VLG50_05945 [Candidatus Saccharimonadales bacterium]|nr:hypothetical protein [Candidatus Saccharimonadales bacterium]
MSETLNELESAYIQGYEISLFSYDEMLKLAGEIIITESKTSPDIINGPGGINDSRMGTLSLTDKCKTCTLQNCPGHLGLIKFGKGKETIHPHFIRTVVKILNCVCHSCSRVLFCNELINSKIMSDELKSALNKPVDNEIRLTNLEVYCKKIKRCTCDYSSKNCNIKKCDYHIKLKALSIKDDGTIQYTLADKSEESSTRTRTKKPKKEEEEIKIIYTHVIHTILKNITHEDANYLGFIGKTRPVDLILFGLLVTPPMTRAPITDKKGETIQNPITSLYIDVVKSVNNTSNSPGKIYKSVKNLLVKNDNHRRGGQEVKTYSELMHGKKGIYRSCMMGKRVNWCARTVADPGEHLRYGQEAIPEVWATILTKPRKITHFNIDFFQQLLDNKKINHIIDENGARRPIDYTKTPLEKLQIGQEVERQLENKDRIYMNRQPSLHKGSMQGFEIVLEPGNVAKSHLSITTPMNLDHDGDELNFWIPQNYDVEAELAYIFNTQYCIISTATGKANMGLVMNSVTALNLLSQSEVSEELYFNLIETLTNKEALPTLEKRLNQFGFKLFRVDVNNNRMYLGRAIISALFPPTFEYRHKDVVIYDGIMVSGILTKSQVGPSGRTITQELVKHFSLDRGADFLTDAPFLSNMYIAQRGFTVGYKDCLNMVIDSKAELVNKKYNPEAKTLSDQYDQLYHIVFTNRHVNDITSTTERVKTIIHHLMQSRDLSFNNHIGKQLHVLTDINDLLLNINNTECDLTLVSDVVKQYQNFLKLKKETKLSLIVLKNKYDDILDSIEFKTKTIADPFLFKLRMMLNSIDVLFLLSGDSQITSWIINVQNKLNQFKIANYNDLVNQLIYAIFVKLNDKLNEQKTNELYNTDSVKKTLSLLDKTLKLYQFEKSANMSIYQQFKQVDKQIDAMKMNQDIFNLITTFIQSIEDGILKPFLMLPKPKIDIAEKTDDISQFYQSINNQFDIYVKQIENFVHDVYRNMIHIAGCHENEVKNKNNFILGIYNEHLFMMLTTVYKHLKNVLNQEYNRNYVTKKEEMVKLLLDIEAMGGKGGLKPEEAEFKEIQLMEKLNIAKSIGARLAKEVPRSNAILLQTEEGAGTKGSSANLGQIMGAVGQQILKGERLWHDQARLSSHYDLYDEHPKARGLIESSFLDGLSPSEMFFVQAAGQESVVKSALSVSDVGKLERFMQRAFENVIIAYDGSVRNSHGFIYSTSYNNGFDIAKTISVPTIDMPHFSNFIDLNITMDYQNHARGWYSKAELKKTNIKKERSVSLEQMFTDMINDTETIESIIIHSKFQSPEMKLTKYEKARLIGTRANQLNNNAIPRVDIGEMTDAFDIAKLEYDAGVLANEPALFIIRTMPNGNQIYVYPTLDNI